MKNVVVLCIISNPDHFFGHYSHFTKAEKNFPNIKHIKIKLSKMDNNMESDFPSSAAFIFRIFLAN